MCICAIPVQYLIAMALLYVCVGHACVHVCECPTFIRCNQYYFFYFFREMCTSCIVYSFFFFA